MNTISLPCIIENFCCALFDFEWFSALTFRAHVVLVSLLRYSKHYIFKYSKWPPLQQLYVDTIWLIQETKPGDWAVCGFVNEKHVIIRPRSHGLSSTLLRSRDPPYVVCLRGIISCKWATRNVSVVLSDAIMRSG